MSLWILIWVLVSGALLYFAVWSAWITLRQKQAWQSFAKKTKLRYEAAGLFTSPKLGGLYKDYSVSLFPCEHQTPDARGVRKLIGIEVDLKSKMPFEGAIATGGMVSVVEDFGFPEEWAPSEKWADGNVIMRNNNSSALSAYLTGERLRALSALAKIKNAWMIFIFKDGKAILRVDTPDPLDSQKKIAAILHKMIEAAKVLELAKNEDKRIMVPKAADGPGKVVPVEENAPENGVGLQLEEEVSSVESQEEDEKKEP